MAEADAELLRRVRATPARVAAIHRYLEPGADEAHFALWVRERLPGSRIEDAAVARLYAQYAPARMSLVDRAYVAGVHPLELWTARFLRERPSATQADAIAASAAERQEAYAWLFRTRSKSAQDARIRATLERAAFDEIRAGWQRLGYPFRTLSPSLGTALGSSADRPKALAELAGILLNDGLRVPVVRVTEFRFAEGTPFETHFAPTPRTAERVLEPEVAAAARSLLAAVVEGGTAARLQGAFRAPDGTPLAVGGKTGTGDHRVDTHGRDGRVVASRVISRSGTFVFLLGPRHFGTITAYVSGPRAADYRFTSALPTQVLKSLAPTLQDAIGPARRCAGPGWVAPPELRTLAPSRAASPAREPLDTVPSRPAGEIESLDPEPGVPVPPFNEPSPLLRGPLDETAPMDDASEEPRPEEQAPPEVEPPAVQPAADAAAWDTPRDASPLAAAPPATAPAVPLSEVLTPE